MKGQAGQKKKDRTTTASSMSGTLANTGLAGQMSGNKTHGMEIRTKGMTSERRAGISAGGSKGTKEPGTLANTGIASR